MNCLTGSWFQGFRAPGRVQERAGCPKSSVVAYFRILYLWEGPLSKIFGSWGNGLSILISKGV